MKHVTQEDLDLDRRVTRSEADIGHNKEKIDSVDRSTKFVQAWYIAGYVTMVTLFVGLFVGQYYAVQNLGDENQQQFGEVKQQMVELHTGIDETNKRIDETNKRIDETNERIDETNKRIDETNERLAVVENVLTINHQPSGYYQTGKL